MSKRRKPGDWVWLKPYSGFVGESNRLKAQIQVEDYETQYGPDGCMMDCDDPECREWATLLTEPDPLKDGKQHVLCHVSECQMLDEPFIVIEPKLPMPKLGDK